MKNVRKGLGKGLGMGYKNIAPMDSHIHTLSAKGVVTYKKTKSGGSVRIGTNVDGTKNYIFFPSSAYGHELDHLQTKRAMKKLELSAKGSFSAGGGTEELMANEWGWNYMKQPKKKRSLNAKDMLLGKKWDIYIGKDLETHTITRNLGWGKYRVAQVNLSKRNVPFEGVKYFVSAGVDEMKPIGLAKDMVRSKTLRHKFLSFRKYKTAKRNVSKLKKEYRKVI